MQVLKEILCVAGGGAIGAVLRYLLSGAVERALRGSGFPGGTLAVNVLGCLALGALLGLAEERWELSQPARLFWTIGLLGSLTTFSALGYETLALLREGKPGFALASVLGNLLLGVGAAALGYWAGTSGGGRG